MTERNQEGLEEAEGKTEDKKKERAEVGGMTVGGRTE